MKWLLPAVMVMLCASGFTTAQAETRKKIKIEVEFGASYAAALGSVAAEEARQLAEQELALSLGDVVRYFEFVPSSESASHTLSFRIGYPTQDHNAALLNIHDSYVFLTSRSEGSSRTEEMHWLFRGAASNLSGVDTPQSIAESLSQAVRQHQSDRIIEDLLNQVSFTESASFKSDNVRGWYINHSPLQLCMHPNSEVKIHSTIPNQGLEDEFDAQVIRNVRDSETTFAKAISGTSSLTDNSEVVGVRVLRYVRECEQAAPVTESSPTTVSFDSGGGS